MPFNGNSLVDGPASDFGTVTNSSDKLFYSIEKLRIHAILLSR